MANEAFDRVLIRSKERPLSSDINTLQSQMDRALREVALQLFTARAAGGTETPGTTPSGFIGGGLKVRASATPGLSIRVAAGLGFLYAPGDLQTALDGVLGADDLSKYKPLPLLVETTISGITAGPPTGFRYDIVEARVNRVAGNPLSRDTLDTVTGLFVSGNVNKTLAFTLDGSTGVVTDPAASTAALSYKMGINNGAEPSVTAGYVKLATIYSLNGNMVGSITRANIIDRRDVLVPYGMMPFSASFSVPSGASAPPTSVLLDAPPGIECVVVKDAAPSQGRFTVYLVGGALTGARGNMQGEVVQAFTAGEFLKLQYQGTTFGTMDTAKVALLANAAVAGPALAFAEGTPYMATSFGLHRQVGGTTTESASIPDPALVAVQGFLQRY